MSGFDLSVYLDGLSEQAFDTYVEELEEKRRNGPVYVRMRATSLLKQVDAYVERTLR